MSCTRRSLTDGLSLWSRPKSAPLHRKPSPASDFAPAPRPNPAAQPNTSDQHATALSSVQEEREVISDDVASTLQGATTQQRSALYRRLLARRAPLFSKVPPLVEPDVGEGPSKIEERLVEALSHTSRELPMERLAAYRLAFEDYIHTASVRAQSLLKRIYAGYEEALFKQHGDEVSSLQQRVVAMDARCAEAQSKVAELRRLAENQRLELANLHRELRAKNELLAQISATYKVNVSSVNWITGVENKIASQRTMAEIRSIQKRVTSAYGEARRSLSLADAADSTDAGEWSRRDESEMSTTARPKRAGHNGEGSALLPDSAEQVHTPSDPRAATTTLEELYVASQRVEKIGVELAVEPGVEVLSVAPKPLVVASAARE